MAQITSGVHAIFSHPAIYNIAQRLVGAEKGRHLLVRDYFPKQGGFRLLDIGCGTAEILRHLSEDVDYHGFDASKTYIEEARSRFGDRGTFRAELVQRATLESMQPFDMVMAFGLLHHLDDEEATSLFELAQKALRPGGKFLSVDPVFADSQNPLVSWIISKDRGRNIRTPEAYKALAATHFSDTRASVRHDLLNIPYSHMILECKKSRVQKL